MASRKLSPVSPSEFPWLTFLEDVSHGRFGPRQRKIPEEIKYIFVFGTWHLTTKKDKQKRRSRNRESRREELTCTRVRKSSLFSVAYTKRSRVLEHTNHHHLTCVSVRALEHRQYQITCILKHNQNLLLKPSSFSKRVF